MCEVDRLICVLRRNGRQQKYYFVLWSEYVSHPNDTQEQRASRIGIGHGLYRKLLHEGHLLVEADLSAAMGRIYHDYPGQPVAMEKAG